MSFIGGVISESLTLLAAQGIALLRVALPSLALGGLSLYLTLDIYLTRLRSFVISPNTQSSSVALAAAGLCIVLWCLFQSIAAMAVVRQVTGRGPAQRIQIRRAELRLFAAVLRYLVLAAAWTALVCAVNTAVGLISGFASYAAATITLALGYAFAAARMLFLAPAVVASERGPVLRRAWRLSAGYSAGTVTLWCLAYLLPVLLLEMAGESLLSAMHVINPLTGLSAASLSITDIELMRALLPGVACSLTIANGVGLILLSVMSVPLYWHLTEAQKLSLGDLSQSPEVHAS